MADLNQVRSDWTDLWRRVSAQGDPVIVFHTLIQRYSEPHRVYHTFEHIVDCLDEFRAARGLAVSPDAIEMAIWFHDAAYDSHAADNEEQSARLAAKALAAARLPDPFARKVQNLILATKHQEPPGNIDAKLMLDVDLTILGKTPERFDWYEDAIRAEYAWVPADIFVEKRSAILQSFLNRPAIYETRWFHQKYEHAARANLARSLERLGGRPPSPSPAS